MILVLLFRENPQPLLLELQTNESSLHVEILISTRLEERKPPPHKMSILPGRNFH